MAGSEPDVLRWNDARGHAHVRVKRGRFTNTVSWLRQPTDEELDLAINHAPKVEREWGEIAARRRVLFGWSFIAIRDHGPPKWRLPHPRLSIRKRRLVVGIGWRFTAYELSIGRGK